MSLNSSDILQEVICLSLFSLNNFFFQILKKECKDSSGLSAFLLGFLLFFSGSFMYALLQHGDLTVVILVKFNP